MDIERISKDELTREAWTVQLVGGSGGIHVKAIVRVVYYLRQKRASRRHSWALNAYWTPMRVGSVGRLDAPPRIPDAEILEAVQRRMVVEWPSEEPK